MYDTIYKQSFISMIVPSVLCEQVKIGKKFVLY